MEWTEQERKLARELIQPGMKEFIHKVFVEIKTQNGEELKKNIVALDNARYGEIMKVLYLTEKENKAKLQLINAIARKPKEGKQAPAAPK